MDNMHPEMKAAFAAFPPVLTKSDNTEGYRPDAGDLTGLFRYRFETAGGLIMDCYLDHIKAEDATNVCPGRPASMELIWALVGGIDISEVIDDCKPTIEEEALEALRA